MNHPSSEDIPSWVTEDHVTDTIPAATGKNRPISLSYDIEEEYDHPGTTGSSKNLENSNKMITPAGIDISWAHEEDEEENPTTTSRNVQKDTTSKNNTNHSSSSSYCERSTYSSTTGGSKSNSFRKKRLEEPNKMAKMKKELMVEPEYHSDDDDDEDDSIDDEDEEGMMGDNSPTEWTNVSKGERSHLLSKKKSSRREMMKPNRSACHSCFVSFQIITVLGNLCMMATQIMPMVLYPLNPLQLATRIYLTIFSFFFLLSELECHCIKSQSLGNWISRGFLYTFLGTVTMEQHVASQLEMKESTSSSTTTTSGSTSNSFHKFNVSLNEIWDLEWASLFACWWIIIQGCLYFLFGVCCLKRVRDGCRVQYQDRLIQYYKSRSRRRRGRR